MILAKIYFLIPYIFLTYKILTQTNFSFLKFMIIVTLFIFIYNILRNRKWIYKLTVIIASYLLIPNITFIFLTTDEKNYLGISSSMYSDFLSLLFLLGFIVLYFLNQKVLLKNGDK